MNMVFDSSDFDGLHLVLPGDTAHESPQPLTQRGGDKFASLFCAENQMNVIADVRHVGNSAVPSGLDQCQSVPGSELPGYVRLKACLNSGVKVPVLADTVGPVIESNCAGAITPGGEQLEMNNQSVTRVPNEGTKVNSFRSADLASLHSSGEAHNKIPLPAQREWIAAGGNPQMIGDGMVGSSGDVNQGTTAGGERAGRGQSPRSSDEAGNDRGAKGGRDVVWVCERMFSQKGQHSAARLSVLMRRKTELNILRGTHSEPPARVSEAKACAAGPTLPIALESSARASSSSGPRTGKPDAGEPPVRFGWRATVRIRSLSTFSHLPPGDNPRQMSNLQPSTGRGPG